MKRALQLLGLVAIAASPAFAGIPVPPVTTTPEPMSLALVATGAVALGAGAWYRNRKR
jgi:hypothetical protein